MNPLYHCAYTKLTKIITQGVDQRLPSPTWLGHFVWLLALQDTFLPVGSFYLSALWRPFLLGPRLGNRFLPWEQQACRQARAVLQLPLGINCMCLTKDSRNRS